MIAPIVASILCAFAIMVIAKIIHTRSFGKDFRKVIEEIKRKSL